MREKEDKNKEVAGKNSGVSKKTKKRRQSCERKKENLGEKGHVGISRTPRVQAREQTNDVHQKDFSWALEREFQREGKSGRGLMRKKTEGRESEAQWNLGQCLWTQPL